MRLHKLVYLHYLFVCFAVLQCLFESNGIDTFLKTEVYLRIFLTIEYIIGFILCNGLTEIVADILQRRMTLNRQVTAFPGIEKIETDREFVPKQCGVFTQY